MSHPCRLLLTAAALTAVPALADWSLADQLDRVLAYDGSHYGQLKDAPDGLRGPRSGMLIRTATPTDDGGLKPYAEGMEVGGELRPGQMLISGESMVDATVAEFLVTGGTALTFTYGVSDRAVDRGNHGTRLEVELIGQDRTTTEVIEIADNTWSDRRIELPAGPVLVRLSATRRNPASTNWTGLVVTGDGELGTREQTLARSPNAELLHDTDFKLAPSPHRVTAPDGYDVLFYKGEPLLSYAVKGFPPGSHRLQSSVGVNTYYIEGMSYSRYWPEGAEGVTIPEDSSIHLDLSLCQKFDLPFKSPVSLAHCSPFLPPWLVQQENLGLEGHQLRSGGAHHTSFIKPKTLQYHQRGLEGWVEPFRDQPVIFVFSQEDDISLWDDHSAEAEASWRAWLTQRFAGDFAAFQAYVGGIDVPGFDQVPQPDRFEPDPRFGYPLRLAYLKLLWMTESYGDYLAAMFAKMDELIPGVPKTQRYVNDPHGPWLSRRLGSDYNYTFGHLSVEGVPNAYGIGKKPYTGIYAHAGTLPLPRGGSIGKTYSRDIRRGEMNEQEWRLNAWLAIANGISGFEYSTLTPSWGEAWYPAALYDNQQKLTPTGLAGEKVMAEVLQHAKYLKHYEHFDDVAVFHDPSFNARPFAGAWGQSKVGLYTLIRETGFHPAVLDDFDMTPENLRDRKVLVLGGTLSIAPEVQDAIRDYVRQGGTLISLFTSDAAGFPGCNSYAYNVKPRDSATVASFDEPKAVAHLGDVMGITRGAGVTTHTELRDTPQGTIDLSPFNALVDEGRWVAQQACAAELVPTPDAKVIATFEDGSPAVIEHPFGQGKAITFAVDLGLIANNLTVEGLYRWWTELLTGLGCRQAVPTGNVWVEGGAWRDDEGNRMVVLVNHDLERGQEVKVGEDVVRLGAGEAQAVMKQHLAAVEEE